MSFPRRGEIYWINLDPTVGTEIAKTRPALIISNDIGNEYSPRIIVAPLTAGGMERVYPFQVLVPEGEADLPQTSKIALDQIRTIDKRRLGQRIGTLSPERVLAVDEAIRLTLDVQCP